MGPPTQTTGSKSTEEATSRVLRSRTVPTPSPSVQSTVKEFFQTKKPTKSLQVKNTTVQTSDHTTTSETVTNEIEAELQKGLQSQLQREFSQEEIDQLNEQIYSKNQEDESQSEMAEVTAQLLALLKGPRTPPAPILEGDDIVSWEVFKSKVERGLTSAGLAHHIKDEVSDQVKAEDDYERVNMQVITFITNGLPKNIYRSVGHLTIAHGIWQQLVQRFEGIGTNKLAHIMDRYTVCRDNYTDAATFAAETSKLADELSAITFNAKDLAVYQTKRYLPSEFSGLKPILDHMKDPTQKDLCDAIMEYDYKYLKKDQLTLAAMKGKAKDDTSRRTKKRIPCKHCGRTNHWDDQCRQKPEDDDEKKPNTSNRKWTLSA